MREAWLEHVDQGLEDILWDLNNCGFTTACSCAGHLSPSGKVSSAIIEFEPGFLATPQDVIEVRGIIEKHTSLPFRVRRGIHQRGLLVFQGSLRPNLPSGGEARNLLQAIQEGSGGSSGWSSEKLLSMYDVGELEELVQRNERYWQFQEQELGGGVNEKG